MGPNGARQNQEIAIKENQIISRSVTYALVSGGCGSETSVLLPHVTDGKIIAGDQPLGIRYDMHRRAIVDNDDFIEILPGKPQGVEAASQMPHTFIKADNHANHRT